MYFCVFVDFQSIYKLYLLHRKCLCHILNFPSSFFGFRTIPSYLKSPKSVRVKDLSEAIDKIETKTYRKLCFLAGRKTLRQMTLLSCKNILAQSNFDIWNNKSTLRNKNSDFHNKILNFINLNENVVDLKPCIQNRSNYLKLKTNKERKQFVRLLTNRFFNDQLKRRGFLSEDYGACKFCNMVMDETSELGHILENHFDLFEEMKMKHKVKNVKFTGNISLEIEDHDANILYKLFETVRKDFSANTPRKKRRIE